MVMKNVDMMMMVTLYPCRVNKENLAMGGKDVLRSRCRSQNPNAKSRRMEMTSKVGTSGY
jgi:hypothetical protein